MKSKFGLSVLTAVPVLKLVDLHPSKRKMIKNNATLVLALLLKSVRKYSVNFFSIGDMFRDKIIIQLQFKYFWFSLIVQ
jgi:hypothetical protein